MIIEELLYLIVIPMLIIPGLAMIVWLAEKIWGSKQKERKV